MSIAARRFQRASYADDWKPATVTAGAVTIGSSNYALPSTGTVVYVSSSGSDSNAGTIGSPKLTLGGAISATGGSGTIVMRAGVYETTSQYTIPSGGSGLTIQAYPGEAVWFDGSRTATSWTNNGNGTWTTSYTPLAKISVTGSWGSDTNPDGIAIADQCWIDGVRQTAITDSTTPASGQFSVNRSSNTLTIAINPSGKAVRVSRATTLALCISPTSWLGIGVRRYSPTAIEWAGAAIYSADSNKVAGSVFENCRFEEMGVTAINFSDNTDVTVRQCTFKGSGHTAVFLGGGSALVTRNYFSTINHKQWNAEPTTAAIKVGRTDYLVISHNYVEDVYAAMGIWLDVSNTRSTVYGNYIDGSAGSLGSIMRLGIHYEESDGGFYGGVQYRSLYACNTVIGAQTGIKILAAGYLDVVHNTIAGSSGIGANIYVQQDRIKNPESTPKNKTQEQCPWWTVGNRIYNNKIDDGKRQLFSNTSYTTWGIGGMDHFDAIAGNWWLPVTSGNSFVTLTTRTDGYRTATSVTGLRAYGDIGDTSKFATTNIIAATAPDASAYAVPATPEWSAAIGYPVGYRYIGNPLPSPVPII